MALAARLDLPQAQVAQPGHSPLGQAIPSPGWALCQGWGRQGLCGAGLGNLCWEPEVASGYMAGLVTSAPPRQQVLTRPEEAARARVRGATDGLEGEPSQPGLLGACPPRRGY